MQERSERDDLFRATGPVSGPARAG
jgi:hypothetical protein